MSETKKMLERIYKDGGNFVSKEKAKECVEEILFDEAIRQIGKENHVAAMNKIHDLEKLLGSYQSQLSACEEKLKECGEVNRLLSIWNEKLVHKNKVAVEALKEAHSLISTTGYTELENGAVKMCGNEWPWIGRGIAVMKQALAQPSDSKEG